MHLTDEQLNEYLDHETDDRAQIGLHVSTCETCSARLAALRDLFSEIESLPELGTSADFTVHIPIHPAPALPRSITLAMTLQAALAIVASFLAAPLVMKFISTYWSGLSVPSFANVFLRMQSLWTASLDTLSTLSIPDLPEIPVLDISSLFVMLTVIGVSLLWLVGNGLLLRNPNKAK